MFHVKHPQALVLKNLKKCSRPRAHSYSIARGLGIFNTLSGFSVTKCLQSTLMVASQFGVFPQIGRTAMVLVNQFAVSERPAYNKYGRPACFECKVLRMHDVAGQGPGGLVGARRR